MIELRLVRYHYPAGVEPQKSDKSTGIYAQSLTDLFADFEAYAAKLPEESRWNVYYTLGDTDGDTKRDWHRQDVIPFDIDHIINQDGSFDEEAYISVICDELAVDKDKCAIVASGNGLQILVMLEIPILDRGFFRKNAKRYSLLCARLQNRLDAAGLQATVDTSSFAPNRIMRLPGTENRKEGKPTRAARCLNRTLLPQPFAIQPAAGETAKEPTEKKKKQAKTELSEKELAFFKIDAPAVEDGCRFLRWARENPAEVSEPQWYAMLSIVGRLPDGRAKAHAYSAQHQTYTEKGCDAKLDQAITASGPRTCENIDHIWGQCHTCPFSGKVTSPIMIKSETFIATEHAGFHLMSKSGALTPQFEDLRRHFEKEHPYRSHIETSQVYVFDGEKYGIWKEVRLRGYAHDKFDPKPIDFHATEFHKWVNRTNHIGSSWFVDSTKDFINFKNGVFSARDGKLLERTAAYGFLYVLPYDYVPDALCPEFDKFMVNVTCADAELERLILEFIGYILCDRAYRHHKMVLLVGEGSNGKSTLLDVVRGLCGEENVASLSLQQLENETSRSQLEGRLVNISDELPNAVLKSTELLKKMMGGMMTARRLYHDGMSMRNTAKFIFAGNEIPATTDMSEGLFRRLTIVPFNARFHFEPTDDAAAKPADLKLLDRMLAELPGIFNRAYAAYQGLVARGHFTEAVQSKVALSTYREEVDRTGTWIKNTLYWNGKWDETVPFVEADTVWERYVSDCKRNEEKPLSRYHWQKHLKRNLAPWDERYTRKMIGGRKVHVIKGVEFIKDSQQKDTF